MSQSFSEIERRLTLNTQRELRSKKMDFNVKLTGHDEPGEAQVIDSMLKTHESMYNVVSDHFKKEVLIQEDEFNKKLNRRIERCINKTMNNKSSDRKAQFASVIKNKDDEDRQLAESKVLLTEFQSANVWRESNGNQK